MPHGINQLLRGHNYFYVDFLMTWKFATVEGVRCAIEYFLINIKFLTSFLRETSTHLEEVKKGICSF